MRDDLSPWGTDADTFRARITAAFDRIISAHPGQSVVVVAHGGVINAYAGSLIGYPASTSTSPSTARSPGSRAAGRACAV
jgi:broad specificity phosphatase PhoE